MHAHHIVLTHFSQRYPKIPAASSAQNDSGLPESHTAWVPAFDGMAFSFSALEGAGTFPSFSAPLTE